MADRKAGFSSSHLSLKSTARGWRKRILLCLRRAEQLSTDVTGGLGIILYEPCSTRVVED